MPTAGSIYFSQSRGGGLSLVLVHGAGGTHLHWPPGLRRLTPARVIAVDLPGHGKSGRSGPTSIAGFAREVVALLDRLGMARAVVAGHSMGGAIAQTMALDHSERVAGLVLVGAGARLRVAPQVLDGIAADFPAAVNLIVEWSYGPEAAQDLLRLGRKRMLEVDPEVLLADFMACNEFDVMARVGEIAAPTLVLVGSADRLTPEKYSRYLVEQIPGAQLQVFPGAGHMVMLEQPEAVTRAIGAFVTALRG